MANTSDLGGDYTGVPCTMKSIVNGCGEYIEKITYANGCFDVDCNSTDGFSQVVAIAKKADYVIVVVGLDLSQETEDCDRYSLLLLGNQMTLVNKVAGSIENPPVLVLTGGGPLDISFAKEDPIVASVLWIGYPGEEGRKALSEIIFGDYNLAGRLPMTWYPESFTNVPMNDMSMRGDPSRGYPGRTYRFYTGDTVYEFGHGLSYTKFTLELLSAPSRLSLSRSVKMKLRRSILNRRGNKPHYVHVDEVLNCESLGFSVWISLTNDGDMDGSQVVMFFSRVSSSYDRAPHKQLIGFNRVHVSANKTEETRIFIYPCKHLSIVNEVGNRIFPLGDYKVSQRLMVQGYSGHANYNGGFDVARPILKSEGIRGLYRGFGLSAITYAPSEAVWWGSYGSSQRFIWRHLGHGNEEIPVNHTEGMIVAVQAGGGIIAGATASFDTIKARLQVARDFHVLIIT